MYRQFTDLDIRTREPVETKPDDVVATLRRAARLIRDFGLAKRTQEDDEGRVCFHGAISKAATGSSRACDRPLAAEAQKVAAEFLLKSGAKGIHRMETAYKYSCVNWNNAPERTASEVIAALEGAADARQAALQSATRSGKGAG